MGCGSFQGHVLHIIGGDLEITTTGSYADPSKPNADDFTLVNATTIVGNFDNVSYNGTSLAADFGSDADGSFRDHVGGGLFRNVTYTASTVELSNLNAAAGDVEGDQDVDITDFKTLSANFDPSGANAATNAWTTADFDTDGDVDITDRQCQHRCQLVDLGGRQQYCQFQ